MLRSLLIVSHSGLVLFQKFFVKEVAKVGILGGVVIAMQRLSVLRTGLPVTYIELSKVAVSIASNSRVTCALFVDAEDGPEFAKLMSRELLASFTDTFNKELEEKFNTSPDVYSAFNLKIAQVVQLAVRPVLDQLADERGIKMAAVLSGDTLKHSTQDVDKLGLLANHQALLNVANDIFATQNDAMASVTLKSRQTTLLLQRVEHCSLVVIYKNNVDEATCLKTIERTSRLLRQVLVLSSNLQALPALR